MHAQETELIAAARTGDFQAATELVDRLYARIYAFLRRLSGNEADATDLTQKTFDRLWRALPTFAGRGSASAWVHGIAYHVYLDWRRANQREEKRSETWWAECPDERPDPAAQVEVTDLKQALFRAVGQLESNLRGAVHLHYYQGLTLEETASVLEISLRTVKYWLREALEQLQTRLERSPEKLLSPP